MNFTEKPKILRSGPSYEYTANLSLTHSRESRSPSSASASESLHSASPIRRLRGNLNMQSYAKTKNNAMKCSLAKKVDLR